MNFKLVIILFLVSGCGVKTRPSAPANTVLPSIIDQYKSKTIESKKKSKKATGISK